jgi:arylsulfatase A-like enzyme
MIDHWFGRIVEALERTGRWADTAVVLCTDHGHYLGEKDIWGKPGVPVYEPLGHIPLLVAWPGREAGVVDALTTSVDLFATLADVFGVRVPQRTHGHSLVPLLEGRQASVREFALTGVWGREVHVTDGHRKYARAPVAENRPLAMWSNRWSTMPVPAFPDLRLPRPDRRARLDYMPGSDVPVIRQPFAAGDPVPYWAATGRARGHLLFDLDEDPAEEHDQAGTRAEADAEELLRVALASVDAPVEQYERLGLG